MKLGVVLSEPPAAVGGGHTFESEVFQSLVKFGHDSGHTFVVFGWSEDKEQKMLGRHIQFVSLHRSFRQRVNSRLFRTTRAIFKKLRHPTDPIKIESRGEELILKSGVQIMLYLTPYPPITMEIPYITVVWDLQHCLQPYFPEVSAQGQWDYRERLYGTMLRRASVIITGTATGKAEIERFYQIPAERITILPHPTPGFALDVPSGDPRKVLARYNIPEKYLFYPAQFWSHKNHAGLLIAVQLLRDKYNLVLPVVFVGSDKGNQQYIRQLVAEFNLTGQVYFLGFVPQQDLIMLYRNAFALTYVTFFGPENLPPLEAFALGCPVIASDVPGAQEQLGDAALLVSPGDAEEIAVAVKSLHENPALCQTLVQRGRERASRSTGRDFVRGVLSRLDEFEPIRRCWSSQGRF